MDRLTSLFLGNGGAEAGLKGELGELKEPEGVVGRVVSSRVFLDDDVKVNLRLNQEDAVLRGVLLGGPSNLCRDCRRSSFAVTDEGGVRVSVLFRPMSQ